MELEIVLNEKFVKFHTTDIAHFLSSVNEPMTQGIAASSSPKNSTPCSTHWARGAHLEVENLGGMLAKKDFEVLGAAI